MAWQKKKLDWTWYEDYAKVHKGGEVAALIGELASRRQLVKYVFRVSDDDICVISCKGTIPPKKKAKAADDEAEDEAED